MTAPLHCTCQSHPTEERIIQPEGECPFHGDEEMATRQAYEPLEEGEEWANPM